MHRMFLEYWSAVWKTWVTNDKLVNRWVLHRRLLVVHFEDEYNELDKINWVHAINTLIIGCPTIGRFLGCTICWMLRQDWWECGWSVSYAIERDWKGWWAFSGEWWRRMCYALTLQHDSFRRRMYILLLLSRVGNLLDAQHQLPPTLRSKRIRLSVHS